MVSLITVGIIANPASGKDIRRLIAHGSVFDNQEKVNIVRRVLIALQAVGVGCVVFMPDYYGIGRRAADGIRTNLDISILPMRIEANQDDSILAARLMRQQGVGAVITLGGDGTNRAVAKEIGDVPVMPISTGTNNVFPQMIEGTVAGMATGIVAKRILPLAETTSRQLRLEVKRDGQVIDIALVDVAAMAESFLGSRAIWDTSKVREIVLTHASPSNIGLSSLGGSVYCAQLDHQHGVYLRLNEGASVLESTAPIAPGLLESMTIAAYRLMKVGDEAPISHTPCILALDGEREVMVGAKEHLTVELSDRGPLVIDVHKTLSLAARCGLMQQAEPPVNTSGNCRLLTLGLCLNPTEKCFKEPSA